MSETINVNIGGETVSVVIEGGALAPGMSIALEELNAAVSTATQAASDASVDANSAQQSATDAQAAADSIPGMLVDRAMTDGSNAIPEDFRTAISALSRDGSDATAGEASDLRKNLDLPRIITTEGYATPEIAAAAAYAADVPFLAAGAIGSGTDGAVVLTINPAAEASANTDAARGAVLMNAVAWASKCFMVGGAQIDIRVVGGRQAIEGQVALDSFLTSSESPAIKISMAAAVSRNLDTTGNIVFGASVLRVLPNLDIPVGSEGTGYADSFALIFSGGGGTGASGTAYASGGVLTGAVLTSGGTGYTSAPTVSLANGGGTGGAVNATVSRVYPVTVPLTAAPPANAVVGMPVGIRAVRGVGDASGINGAAILTAVGASSISFDMLSPQTSLAATNTPSAGQVLFPGDAWFAVRGGYTGNTGGREAFLNASNNEILQFENLFACWEDGPNQRSKLTPAFAHTGIADGKLRSYNNVVAAGFPVGVRLSQGSAYLNRFHVGGGLIGEYGLSIQTAGSVQVASSAMGGFRSQCVQISRGSFASVVAMLGFAPIGFRNLGGVLDYTAATVAGCSTGLLSTFAGTSYSGTSGEFIRNTVAIEWDVDSRVIGTPTFTGSRSADTFNSMAKGVFTSRGAFLDNTEDETFVVKDHVFAVDGTQKLDIASTTAAGSSPTYTATLNKMAGLIATPVLSLAAGAAGTITVTCNKAKTGSQVHVTRNGGSNSAGQPAIWASSIVAGSFVINIENWHPSAALNGSLSIFYTISER